MNLNRHLRVVVVFLLFSLAPKIVFSGSLTIYDDVAFVTYRSGDDIYGYYFARENQFSCGFMFFANASLGEKDEAGVSALKLKTFDFVPYKEPSKGVFSYDQRDPRASIAGTLYMSKDAVGLMTDTPQGGCLSVAGIFSAPPGTRGAQQFEPKKELKAIGIGVASRKTFIYKKAGGVREGRYLVLGDFVAVLAREGNYYYIRYVNPDMMIDDADPRKVSLGWVHSSDISNPFPSSLKQELRQ